MSYSLLFKTKNPSFFSVTSSTREDLMYFNKEAIKVEYSPSTLLEEDECFEISKFSNKPFCPNFLKIRFALAEYAQWEISEENIEFILNTDTSNFYFQKFTKSQILDKSWFSMSIGGEPKLRNEKIFTINPLANALYNKKGDILLFRKLEDLKNIFPGIEELYREASQEEVDEFLNHELFNTTNYDKTKMGISNRKRIALYKDKVEQMSDNQGRQTFCQLLQKYSPSIEQKDNAIIIKTENDLKNILFGLDERFYTTQLSKEKRLANSVIKLP